MDLLVIDVGNTSVSVGRFSAGEVSGVFRLPTRFDAPPALPGEGIAGVAIASVVPEANAPWRAAVVAAGLPEPLFVRHDLDLGVGIDYPAPETIGADRLANAAAAARLAGCPSVVCDFGTALTFDVLDAERGYVGGVICPGLPLMFDYLAEKTALLPHVEPTWNVAAYGRSTEEAMQVGARAGYRGMVREVLAGIRRELNAPDLPLLCTGGYAGKIFEAWDVPALVDPLLTLRGIGLIAERNLA